MKTEVVCPQCGNHFYAYGTLNKLARCPRCSSTNDSFIPASSPEGFALSGNQGESIKALVVPFKYTCSVCSNVFDYDASTGRQPYCSRCRSLGTKPKTPSVVVYSGPVVSKTGIERYSENTNKALKSFDQATQVAERQMLILGLPEKRIDSFRSFMSELRSSLLSQVQQVRQGMHDV